MNSKYAIWVRIDCMHEYFRDGKCDRFAFVPSSDTRIHLQNARLRTKTVGNSFLLITEKDDANHAIVSPEADVRLVFYLDLQDPTLLTVTNVNADALRSARYHFSNLHDNQAGESPDITLHLTRPLGAFVAGREYIPGELASKAEHVYECIQTGTNQEPDEPGSLFWVDKGELPFTSNKDLVPIRSMLSSFTVGTAANAFVVKVHGLDLASHAYDALVREEVLQISPLETTKDVQVDLTGLPPGRYRLEINGETFEAYFDDEAVSRNAFGVVELYHHLPKTSPYSPVDESDEIRELGYVIRFANRRAFWKYVTPLHKVDDIFVSGDHEQPSPFTPGSNNPSTPPQNDFFLSKQPLGLSEKTDENLFDLMIGSESRPAPKPDPHVPGLLTQTFHSASGTYRDSICTIRLNL